MADGRRRGRQATHGDGTRTCPKCEQRKTLSEFPLKGKHRDGTDRYAYCKPCHSVYQREKKLSNVFGLTPEEYEVMVAHQNGVCAICGKPPKNRRLAIDHDHATGLIRGALCFVCNRGLAYWRDDPERISRASNYITEPPAVRALGREVFGRKGRVQKNKRRRNGK